MFAGKSGLSCERSDRATAARQAPPSPAERHPGERRDPVCAEEAWIPAFAGMTEMVDTRRSQFVDAIVLIPNSPC
jgi:hypothetical protein